MAQNGQNRPRNRLLLKGLLRVLGGSGEGVSGWKSSHKPSKHLMRAYGCAVRSDLLQMKPGKSNCDQRSRPNSTPTPPPPKFTKSIFSVLSLRADLLNFRDFGPCVLHFPRRSDTKAKFSKFSGGGRWGSGMAVEKALETDVHKTCMPDS